MATDHPVIAVLGGTGALGQGLARRWAGAGYSLILGSRSPERAAAAAGEMRAGATASVEGCGNAEAVVGADIIVLAVPYAGRDEILEAVREGARGKVFVDATVPLSPPVARVSLPPEGAAGRATQEFLGDDVKVVSALQNVAADHLTDPDHDIDCDVLVCGNDRGACECVIELVEALGLRGWHAGRIENAAAAEALTSVLIFINRRYGIDGAGLRITGAYGDRDAGGANT